MHGFPLFYSPFAPALVIAFTVFILSVALWTVILKGYALWHAARNSQKGWFIALLVINTVGILEIVYLIWYRPKSDTIEESPVHISSSV